MPAVRYGTALLSVVLLWCAESLTFQNVPLAFRHQSSPTDQKYLLETMGAGIAVADVDGDGRLDLFFVNGAVLPANRVKYPNRLYRNLGNWRFVDVTDQWGLRGQGYGMGVAAGDYNNDGRTDFYVTGFERNYLYRNTGSKFEEVAVRA